jgi:hypothetical protein
LIDLALTIELVPATSWGNNIRAVMTAKQWNALSGIVCNRAYNVCEICGGVGPKHPVECHEIWEYNDRKQIQRLAGMIALCPDCHMVKHIGYARVQGKYDQAAKHFRKVNGLKKIEAEETIKTAFQRWRDRSKQDWTLDLSHLKRYGIDPEKLKEPK